jgi:UPF0716 protein FxsA
LVPVLFLIFIVLPIAELYVIIQVGQSIGVLLTLALLIVDSIVGTWLLRHQGRTAWDRFRTAINEGRMPATETIDGGLVILGGAFLITPGFITDIIGICLLLPPTRALLRRIVSRRLVPRMVIGMRIPGRGPDAAPGRPPTRAYDVEGSATDTTDRP